MKLLHDVEWLHWRDREIARHAKVDNKTVSRLLEEIAPKVTEEILSEPRTFTTKDGTTAKMKTGKIGASRTPSTHLSCGFCYYSPRAPCPQASEPEGERSRRVPVGVTGPFYAWLPREVEARAPTPRIRRPFR